MRTLTASDRSALIKLAASLPEGSPEKKAILAGLQGSSKAASLGKNWTKPWANFRVSTKSVRIEILSGLSSPFVMFDDVSSAFKRLEALTNDIKSDIAQKLRITALQGSDILRPASTKDIVMGTTLVLENGKLEDGGNIDDKVMDLFAEHGLYDR